MGGGPQGAPLPSQRPGPSALSFSDWWQALKQLCRAVRCGGCIGAGDPHSQARAFRCCLPRAHRLAEPEVALALHGVSLGGVDPAAPGRRWARSPPVVPRRRPCAVVGKEAPTGDRVFARSAAVLLPPLMQPGCHGSAGLSKEAVLACGAHTRVGARTPRHAHTHACTHAHATRGPGEERRRWRRAAVPRTTRGTAGGWAGGVRAAEPSWDPLPINPFAHPTLGRESPPRRTAGNARGVDWTPHHTTRHGQQSPRSASLLLLLLLLRAIEPPPPPHPAPACLA